MKLIVEDQKGGRTVVPFAGAELSIGRQEGNSVRLDARNISRHHARLLRANGTVMVEDLGSYNGVRVNGEAIQGQVAIREGDQIAIGDYNLAIEAGDTQPSAQPSSSFLAFLAERGRSIRTAVIRAPPELGPSPGATVLPPEERPFLLRLDGKGGPIEIPKSDVTIGRDSSESDLILDHRSISRRHARLWLDPDTSWHISDLNSVNGLRVNDETYRESPLHPGDVVELGHVRLRFLGPGERLATAEAGATWQQWVRSVPRWVMVAGLVTLIGGVELVRWSGSLSRVAPYFGNRPAPTAEPPPPAPAPAVIAESTPSPATAAPEPQTIAPPETPPAAPPATIDRKVVSIPPRAVAVASRSRMPKQSHAVAAPEGLETPVQPDPVRAAQAYEDAISLINSSDFPDALAKLHEALQWNPQLAEAHKAMGICFANLHQPDKGAWHYEQYLKLQPQASDAADVRRLLSDYYRTVPDRAPSPAAPRSALP